MTYAESRAIVLELIGEIAPDADLASARDQDDLRQVFDVDSMEFANLVITIHDRLGGQYFRGPLQSALHCTRRSNNRPVSGAYCGRVAA